MKFLQTPLSIKKNIQNTLNNTSLFGKKYFKLNTTNPLLFIDTVYYENPSTATLSLWMSPSASSDDAAFTLEIDDRILNGFKPLVTEVITVDASAPLFEDPFEVEIYAAGKRIIITTNDMDMLPEQMKVFSAASRLVEIHSLERSSYNEVRTNLKPGIYVVILETQAAPVYEKVIIR
jgi:hypothetical protein